MRRYFSVKDKRVDDDLCAVVAASAKTTEAAKDAKRAGDALMRELDQMTLSIRPEHEAR